MRPCRFTLGAVSLAAAGFLAATPALAHTTKNAGPFALTFGWRDEPAYTGVGNAVQVFIKDAKGAPVDEIGSLGLTVAVSTGSGATARTSSPFPLKGAFDADTGLGTHGEFDAPILPTTAGTYTLHITGNINGTAVDVTETSSDKTFADVTDPTAIEFPVQTQTIPQLSAAITTLQDRLAGAQTAATAANSSATSSRTLATVAIAVAVVLGLVSMLARRGSKSA